MPPAKRVRKTAEPEKQEEFEVERIVEAKVKSKKNKNIQWLFLVKWKGYGSKDNSWEPEEAFIHAKEALRGFWREADTGGRDRRAYGAFQTGDVVKVTKKKPARRTAAAKSVEKETVSTTTKVKPSKPKAGRTRKDRKPSVRSTRTNNK